MCGSSAREPLALGLWRCSGTVVETSYVALPNENGPRSITGQPMTMVNVPFEQSRPCGHEYQDYKRAGGSAPPRCRICRDHYSVALCADCRQPVCGYPGCSGLRESRRLCRPHAAAYDAEQRARADELNQRAAEEEARRREEHDLLVRQRQRTPDGQAAMTEERQLNRKIARVGSRRIATPPWPIAFWLMTLTGTWFVVGRLAGGEDAIPVGPMILLYVVETSLIIWWYFAAEHAGDTTELRRRLSQVKRRRGCGQPSCQRCYP